MINLEYSKKQFDIFTKKYNLSNEKITLKINHSKRVMKLCMEFARYQGLDEENIKLSGVIGLLHDIGRFVQIEEYDTFKDGQSIDHCDAGVELLFEQNYIIFFVKDEKYYNIIKKAIKNHGKLKIEDGLDEITLIHSKIIRDADKTDIYEVILAEKLALVSETCPTNELSINEKVLYDFYNHNLIKNENVKNPLDEYIRSVAFIYDYNFKESLKYILKKGYISKITENIINRYDLKNETVIKQIYEVRDYANRHLREQI